MTASGVKPVYDITVDGTPEFFAGGLLVHNCVFTGAQGERSPDRLDSLCWSATPFLPKSFGPTVPAGVRRWAAAGELEDAGKGPDAALELRRRRRLAGQHGGAYDRPQGWDLDDFAPQPDETGADGGRGGAVHAWH